MNLIKPIGAAVLIAFIFILGYHLGGEEMADMRDRIELEKDATSWRAVPREIKALLEGAGREPEKPKTPTQVII